MKNEIKGVLLLAVEEKLNKVPYYFPILKDVAVHLGGEIQRKELDEELYRIFTSASDGIIVAGFDGFLKKVNPAMSYILGYTEEELTSTPFIEFVHPDDRERTLLFYEEVNSGIEKSFFENRYITKSGQVIWLAWTFKVFHEEEITYSVAKDVTVQKELEELLEKANRLAKIGNWEVDLIHNKVYWPDITREIHDEEPGFTPELETGFTYYKQGESRQRIRKAVEETLKNKTGWDLELPIITGKGNEKWIRTIGEAEFVDGVCVRIYGSFQDIHSQKVAEEKLIERTRQLDAIAQFNALLIKKENWLEALDESLGTFGNLVDADRVYYFECNYPELDEEPTISMKIEWVKEGVDPQLENTRHYGVPFNSIQQFIDPLIENRPFNYIVREITDVEIRELLRSQDIKSLLAVPVFVNSVFRGIIGFDDCTRERVWNEQEISILQTISINLASAIENTDAERALQQAFNEKNEILESVGDGFFTVNSDFVVTYWNNKAEEMLQTKKENILGLNLWDRFDKNIAPISYREYCAVLNTQKPVKFEEYYEPLNSWFDINVYPSGNGLSVFFKDITEKKASEALIHYKTTLIEAIAKVNSTLLAYDDWFEAIHNTLDIMGEAVGADRVYYFENHKDDASGTPLTSQRMEWCRVGIVPQIDNPEMVNVTFDAFREFMKPIAENKIYASKRENVYDPDLRELMEEQEILSLLIIPVFVHQQFWGFIGFDDCTGNRVWTDEETSFLRTVCMNLSNAIEASEADRELQKLNSELKTKVKELAISNDELEQFAFVASHDLQEPLRMITGFLSQLEKKYDHILDEKGRKYIYYATDGAKRMRQIILDLLNYSRVGRVETEIESVDLNEVLEDAVALNRKLIKDKDADVSWDEMPVIHTSKAHMQQLFQNLLNNALNYQEPNNVPVVKIMAEQAENEWLFSIQDNGIGIDPGYSEKIFNIFQRLHTKDEYSGTGVGLAICKKIVEDFGGEIWVESEAGKGSVFKFTLPEERLKKWGN